LLHAAMAKHFYASYFKRVVPSALIGLSLLAASGTHATELTRQKTRISHGKLSEVSAEITRRQAMRQVAYTPPVVPHARSLQQSSPPAITKKASLQALLRSEAILVQDLETSTVLYDKNSDETRPIASISKLMAALIVAEANLPM